MFSEIQKHIIANLIIGGCTFGILWILHDSLMDLLSVVGKLGF